MSNEKKVPKAPREGRIEKGSKDIPPPSYTTPSKPPVQPKSK